jgi:hypothetical protein
VPHKDEHDAWLVLDGESGQPVAEADLACHAIGSLHLPHPDGERVGLVVFSLNDHSHRVYWGRLDEHAPAGLVVERPLEWLNAGAIVGLHPTGEARLSAPKLTGCRR